MKLQEYFQRFWTYLTGAWNKGKIQRTSRITYDIAWNIILFFIISGTIIAVFAGGVGAGYFASLVKDEPIRDYESMRNDIYNYEETSKLYFADNKYIGDIRADLHREEIMLDDVADVLTEAVIATEDQLFYEHHGIVPKAIVRAMYQEFSNSDTQTGGSTLTQQLIKNQILTNEVSFERKAKEILLAMRLENFFEKDEIMEAYLNIIPYGRDASGKNIAGIQTAAKGVFGEDPKDLTLPQAAFLAGIPQNPFAYTPFTNKGEVKEEEDLKRGKERMKTVLKRMYKEEFITKKQYNDAIDYDIQKDFVEQSASPSEEYPAVVDELERRAKKIIIKQIAEGDGLTIEDIKNDKELIESYQEQADRALRRNGYHIHSTIDKKMYDTMKKIGKQYEFYGPDHPKTNEIVDAGAVLMENESGRVLSFFPGREYKVGDNVYNYATQAHRQPGSTIKPLAVYAPAMELGKVQPGSVIADVPTPNGKPRNYGGGYYGLVSAREALTYSYNVTAHYIYTSIIDENPGKKYLRKMGIPISDDELTYPSVALGGTEKGVTVEENTSAFTTLSNNGEHMESYMIEKITDSNGNTIYEHETEPVRVFSPQTAYLTIDMLRDVIKKGTGASLPRRLKHGGVDWAGKTGTSNDYKDAWFVGTNANITLGTWIGYDTPNSIYCPGCSLGYSQRNQFLWADFVNALTDLDSDIMVPKKGFKQPEGIVSRSYCSSSGMAPSDICAEAGLVRTDIYNSKYVPNKQDDSLIGGDMPLVIVDGEQVIAGDKTPSEFTTSEGGGFAFNPKWIARKGYERLGDLSQLIPRRNAGAWKKINTRGGSSSGRSGEIENDDGRDPTAPGSVNNQGYRLTWSGKKGDLIVGYRIFRASEKDGSTTLIGHTTDNSYNIPHDTGVYYVKAVNYFGRESALSSSVQVGSPDRDENKQDNSDIDEEPDKDKEQDSSNFDNNGSDNNNDDNNDSNDDDNNDNDNEKEEE